MWVFLFCSRLKRRTLFQVTKLKTLPQMLILLVKVMETFLQTGICRAWGRSSHHPRGPGSLRRSLCSQRCSWSSQPLPLTFTSPMQKGLVADSSAPLFVHCSPRLQVLEDIPFYFPSKFFSVTEYLVMVWFWLTPCTSQPLATTILLSVSRNLTTLESPHMWKPTVLFYHVTCLLHRPYVIKVHPL